MNWFSRNGPTAGNTHVPPLPHECVHGAPITGELLDRFWAWVDARCPLPDGASRESVMLKAAARTGDCVHLDALAGHSNPWIRLAVVNNPAAPIWALWGDGNTGLGLAADPDPWVRFTLLLRYPQPPASILERIVESVRASEDATDQPPALSFRSA